MRLRWAAREQRAFTLIELVVAVVVVAVLASVAVVAATRFVDGSGRTASRASATRVAQALTATAAEDDSSAATVAADLWVRGGGDGILAGGNVANPTQFEVGYLPSTGSAPDSLAISDPSGRHTCTIALSDVATANSTVTGCVTGDAGMVHHVTASYGSSTVDLTWDPPSNAPGPIGGYRVYMPGEDAPVASVTKPSAAVPIPASGDPIRFDVATYGAGFVSPRIASPEARYVRIVDVNQRGQTMSLGLGWPGVVLNPTPTDALIDAYDIFVSDDSAWSVANTTFLQHALAAGKKIVTFGNDTRSGLPFAATFASPSNTALVPGAIVPDGNSSLAAALVVGPSAGPSSNDSQAFIVAVNNPNAQVVERWSIPGEPSYVASVYYVDHASGGQWIHFQTVHDVDLMRSAISWLLGHDA